MVRTTANSLMEAIANDCSIMLTPGVICDYGFQNVRTEEEFQNLFGLYQGLYLRNINVKKLHNACINGKLAEFIDEFYKNESSEYYDWFKQNKSIVKNAY